MLPKDTPVQSLHSLPTDSTWIIDPHNATDSAKHGLAHDSLSHEAGKGELNNASSWDDFPNGRFGDFKSPAFGELNPWGASNISVSSP